MSLRTAVWIAIALLLCYGGWQVLRAIRGGLRGVRPAVATPPAAAVDDEDDADDGDFDYAPIPARTREPQPAAATASAAPPAAAATDAFQIELELQRLRREVAGLRAALDVQQQEIGGLHDSLRSLQTQNERSLVSQNASPEYSEALVFARRGLPVEVIAERCGITVAEAELVRALAARNDDGALQ